MFVRAHAWRVMCDVGFLCEWNPLFMCIFFVLFVLI